jgi:CRP-like cAMP-binding protein
MTGRFHPRAAGRPLEPILRRLRSLATLTDVELDLVRSLGQRRERHLAGEELIAEGAIDARPRFVVSGWACRQRLLRDGRRQIFGLIMPGDAFGFPGHEAAPALASVAALTALETVDAETVARAVQQGSAPGLANGLAAAERLEASLLLDHVVRLGRQTAYERVAHLLLELQQRLEVAGFGDRQRFPLPLTQEMLADALGFSIVHVNRTLQQLRRERLIELRSGVAILLERDRLAAICDYRPSRSTLNKAA